ncbi:TniB family NTP-binding protein [Leptolinea tardivitalis]|uniref:AAA+ ATPase domain-containing protein n=1 Tax=Leptolinea tardivitalis TaxID=229920 RepID=A0A0P6XL95_9CHLR|nr:TniB family NTP-binding protein [Leptolinea tardivitalis]KPL72486.1 hypothetical protein ADM99_04945 [Leptolinea tardivitalis]GAP21232.1 protein containing AAA domain [Leptolinea tardivitalis]
MENQFLNPNLNFIRYPQFNAIQNQITRCRELSKSSLEPQCMSLEGETGCGKSILLKDYASRYPRQETEHGTIIPVFYAEFPSPTTVKSTVAALLEQLGDPGAGKGTVWALNSRLVRLIKNRGVELVLMDEGSNIIESGTNHITYSISDWLKMFIKQTNIPVLIAGMENSVSRIINANPQLSRLFACRASLKPFYFNDEKSINSFSMFISFAEKAIEIPLTTDVQKFEMLSRIHYATDGYVGNIMNLLRNAGSYSKDRQGNCIELNDLSIAFEERLSKHVRTKVNPFATPCTEKFEIPENSDDSFLRINYTISNTLSTK